MRVSTDKRMAQLRRFAFYYRITCYGQLVSGPTMLDRREFLRVAAFAAAARLDAFSEQAAQSFATLRMQTRGWLPVE